MRKYITKTTCSFMLLAALIFCTLGGTLIAAHASSATSSQARVSFKHVCSAAPMGYARCAALVAQLGNSAQAMAINPDANSTGGSAPYGPSNLHSAYNLPTTASGTPTVAIVDAYNDPNAASDLATYRSHYGLPSCTVASGCLRIVNQNGSTSSLPRSNSSWALEESLDLDMVSAICENCHIILVEAKTASFTNLGTGVNTAVRLGAVAVSNSYGGSESSGDASICSTYYQHSFVAVTASSGDSGLGVQAPAVCPSVTAVGGTTLNSNGTETAWNTSSTEGAGGGCSLYIAKPSWESSSLTGCNNRAVADVSADADPATGVAVYDTFGQSGWVQLGGTSVSSPIIAAVYALAGNATSTQNPASLPWGRASTGCLFTVGGQAYAFQTGLGSPKGTGCF